MKRIFLPPAIACSVVALRAVAARSTTVRKPRIAPMKQRRPNIWTNSVATTLLAVSEDDAKFVTEAENGGMAEVELGKLAQEKGQHEDVKAFGEMMVKDHSKANDKLTTLAQAKNITVPTTLGTDQQKVKDELLQKTGREFDKAYIDETVEDHEKDVKLFEDTSKNLKDAELKAFVDKILPTLLTHLEHSKKVKDKLKQ